MGSAVWDKWHLIWFAWLGRPSRMASPLSPIRLSSVVMMCTSHGIVSLQ